MTGGTLEEGCFSSLCGKRKGRVNKTNSGLGSRGEKERQRTMPKKDARSTGSRLPGVWGELEIRLNFSARKENAIRGLSET